MSLEKNELSKYSTYNYIWSLSVLSDDEVNKASYLNSSPKYTIMRTGGFTKSSSILTDAEVTMGSNVEYFIDDVEIVSLVSPNPKSGITMAATINFKVIEPYSVGLFFQTLAIASIQAGHNGNYIRAPMLLRCEFTGYDDAGNKIDMIVRDLAISLIDANFTVDAGGAVYNVSAIPWNHQAYGDEIQQIKTEDKLSGYTVEEVLATGQSSLAAYLNNAEIAQVALGVKKYPNEYLIQFPDSLGNYRPTSDILTGPAGGPAVNSNYQNSVKAADAVASAQANNAPSQTISVTPTGSVTSLPRAGINLIGSSVINPDLNYMGNQVYGLDGLTYDSESNTYRNEFLTIGPDRLFSFVQATPIQNIIEQVILTSTFTRDVISRLEAGGAAPLTWFRIESQVFNLNAEGRKQFVYQIVPYEVDRSLFEKQGYQRSYDNILPAVKKGYNYIYTGLNTDIINFDIKINAAFFQMFLADSASNANNSVPASAASTPHSLLSVVSSVVESVSDTISSIRNVVTGAGVTPTVNSNPGGGGAGVVSRLPSTPGGTGIVDARRKVAEHFHNVILNSNVELVSIDLDVWGDPYFMSDSGMGNHETNRGMSYQQSEVDVILNFNTPIDFDTSKSALAFSSLDQFIGLYKLVTITSSFSSGTFKQTMNMIRRPNQSEQTLKNARRMLVESELNLPAGTAIQYFSNGATASELIYSTLFNSLGLSPLLAQVAAFQNISNILPLPKDLLAAFGTINTFSAGVLGIANSVQQLANGGLQTALEGAANNLVRNVQSNLQNTISSITQPLSRLSNTIKTFKL